MFPVLNLGFISLPIPEFLILIGFWLGSVISDQKAKSFSVEPKLLEKIIWWSLIAGILGARLSYVARFPAAFKGDWLSLFSFNPAFLDSPSGIIIALTVSFIVISREKIILYSILDGLTPFFGIMITSFFLSQFASGNGFGTPANLPWSISLWGEMRHPVQLYFAFASILTIVIILHIKTMDHIIPGKTFRQFALITSGYLLLLSYFQITNLPTISGFRLDQILYWIILCFSLFLYANKNQLNIHGITNETKE